MPYSTKPTRRILLSAIAVTIGGFASFAAPTDKSAAESQALQFLETTLSPSTRSGNPASPSLSLAYTREDSGTPLFYIFNFSDGYIITSADDKFPTILGYSDSGQFDPDKVPVNMKNWLDGYANEMIHYLPLLPDGFGTSHQTLKVKREPIAPLLTTKWNQDSPYNLLCPMDKYGRAVTGCVATAYAQIMNYHEWPAKPVGSANGVDFSNTTYNWRQMIDEYTNGNYTGTQANAVATLMRQCGAAVNMQYSSWSSGAYSTDVQVALPKYFKYASDLQCVWKDYTPQTEWATMIYSELSAKRPVYYSGASTQGGHAFVCDGYSENEYFHFNWGWGGYEDGYFLLTALNPASGGIGSFEDGYTSNQMVITKIRPAEEPGEPTQVHFMSSGGFYHAQGMTFNVQNGENNTNLFYNPLAYTIKVQPGIKITKADGSGTPIYRECGSATKLDSFYGFSSMTVGSIPKLEDGIYHVTPVYRAVEINNDWRDLPVPIGKQNFVQLTSKNGNLSFANMGADSANSPKLIIGTPETMDVVYGNIPVAINVPVVNVGQADFNDYIGFTLMDAESEFGGSDSMTSKYSIPAGSSVNINLVFSEELPAGNYVLSAMNMDGDTYLDNYSVTIKDAEFEPASGSLNIYNLSPNFFTAGKESPIYFSADNLSSQIVTANLNFEILDLHTLNKIKNISSTSFSLPGGESQRFTIRPADLGIEPGEYLWRATDSNGNPVSDPAPMIVYSETINSNGLSYIITSEARKEAILTAPDAEPYSGSVNVPEVIDGYTIKSIRNNAFTFASTTDVTLPEQINSLSPGTFYNNNSLKNLILNSNEIIPYQEDIFNSSMISGIWLNVKQDLMEEWHSKAGWNSMMTPFWLITLDNVEIAEGLEIDPATGQPYAPYRMNYITPLSVRFKAPEGMNVGIILIRNHEWLVEGVVDPAEYTLEIPVLGLCGTGELRAKATNDKVGIDNVTLGAAFDVYAVDGRLIKSNATEDDLRKLPKGIYITNGKKVLIK